MVMNTSDYHGNVTPQKRKAFQALDRLEPSSTSSDYLAQPQYESVKFGEFGKYMDNKRKKLKVQEAEIITMEEMGWTEGVHRDEFSDLLKERSEIFKGCKIWIDGCVFSPPQPVLRRVIVQHGASYVAYLQGQQSVTHIIATVLTPAKVKEYSAYKVVTALWVTESVRQGKKLDWRNYKLKNGGRGEDRVLGSKLQGDKEGWGRQIPQRTLMSFTIPRHPSNVTPQDTKSKPSQSEPSCDSSSPLNQFPRQTKLPPNLPVNIPPEISLMDIDDVGMTTLDSVQENDETAESSLQNYVPPPVLPVSSLAKITTGKSVSQSTSVGGLLIPSTSPISPEQTSFPLPLIQQQNVHHSPHKPGQVRPEGQYNDDDWISERVGPGREGDLLQNEDWRKKHTAANGKKYVEGYMGSSRLHLISTLKLELKDYVAKKVMERDSHRNRRGKEKERKKWKGVEGEGRYFAHVDMDCFFVSAGVTKRPDLKGKPVAVCHVVGLGKGKKEDPSTSEISSCSYEARKFGVCNGMFLGKARELCPNLQTIPYDFELYKKLSHQLYDILLDTGASIQAQSLDEAYLDLSNLIASKLDLDVMNEQEVRKTLYAFANDLRAKIIAETGCTASVGIGENVLLSRLATKKAKPDGVFWLRVGAGQSSVDGREEERLGREWLGELSVRELPGVGLESKGKLKSIGIEKVKDLNETNRRKILEVLGIALGTKLLDYAKGIDTQELEDPGKVRKSVSTEINYGIRFKSEEEAREFIGMVALETSKRLKEASLKGRHLTMRVMVRAADAPIVPTKFMGHGLCDTFSKSVPISEAKGSATDDSNIISEVAWKLLKTMQTKWEDLRGLGVQITKLEAEEQKSSQKKLGFAVTKPGATGKGKGKGGEWKEEEEAKSISKRIPTKLDWSNLNAVASTSKDVLVATEDAATLTQADLPRRSLIDDDDFEALPLKYQKLILVRERLETAESVLKKRATMMVLPGLGPIEQTDFEALPIDIQEELKRGEGKMQENVVSRRKRRTKGNSSDEEEDKTKKTKATRRKKAIAKLPKSQLTLVNKKVEKGNRMMALQGHVSGISLPPSPSDITTDELQTLGLDYEYFQSIPREDQMKVLIQQKIIHRQEWKIFKEEEERRQKKEAKEKKRYFEFEKMDHKTLRGRWKMEEVRDLLEAWFDGARAKPFRDDIQDVRNFLLACLDPKNGRGRDWEKVTQLLKWWKLLITDVEKERGRILEGDFQVNLEAWKKAFDRTKRHVELVSQEVFGSVLKI